MTLKTEISNKDASIMLAAVQGFIMFFPDEASEEESLHMKLTAESVITKIENCDMQFTEGESALILESLSLFQHITNKDKAIAKKGTALYKRTHVNSKVVNRLVSIFNESFQTPKI